MSAAPSPAPNVPQAERKRGYGRWKGERAAQGMRWWVVARGNLLLALGNRWMKVVLVLSLIPGVIMSGITYFFLPLSAAALDGVLDASLVFVFLTAALAGSRLVSEDRRQGAFLAHFARPVTQIDYIAGKFVALALPIFAVATASALFAIAADASVDSTTFADRIQDMRADIPDEQGLLRQASYMGALGSVLWFGIVTAFATTGIVMGLSALTTRARYAGVAWFGLVSLGAAAHGILSEATEEDWPALLSWSDNLTDMSSFLVGMTNDPSLGRVLEFNLAGRAAILMAAGMLGLGVVWWTLRRAEGGVR